MLGHPQEVIPHLRVVYVQLRQGREIPPGLVAEDRQGPLPFAPGGRDRPVEGGELLRIRVGDQLAANLEEHRVDVEPVPVGRIRSCLQQVMERPEAAARVVEDPVQDDPHPAAMCSVEQLAQRSVAPQHRVDVQVVVGVVAVIGG